MKPDRGGAGKGGGGSSGRNNREGGEASRLLLRAGDCLNRGINLTESWEIKQFIRA